VANQDVFDRTVFNTGYFSIDVTVTDRNVVVNSVYGADNLILTGVIGRAGDIAHVTWNNGANDFLTVELAAVFDFPGGILFRDGSGIYYLFSATPLKAGDSHAAATGFGHDDPSTNVTACYVAGTRIATERGPVAVELLRRGDRVRTVLGRGYAPIVWTGRRQVRCASHPRPHEVWPVRIAAGAFGTGLPVRELLVSPGHALFVDGALVPAGALLNGATITQPPCEVVRYHHFELPAHDVALAEGLPAESYVDAGNRDSFSDAGKVVMAIPDFAPSFAPSRAGVRRCAPWLQDTPALQPLRARLRARAVLLGFRDSADPCLRIEASQGGFNIRLEVSPNGPSLVATVPPGVTALRLASLTAVPAEQLAGSGDCRRLGVAVSRVLLDGVELPLDDRRLGLGWHDVEPGHRWTAGLATITLPNVPRPQRLEVVTAPMLRYWHAAVTPLPANRRGLHPASKQPTALQHA